MAEWIDNEFAYRAFSHLPRFRQINNSSTFKLTFRCPVCGDSQTDAMKARGWYYGGTPGNVHCYNCQYHNTISGYLKEYDEELYREYLMEVRKEKARMEPKIEKVPEHKPEPEKKTINSLPSCSRLDKLPEEHPIVKYVKSRCIPKESWNRLWFTLEWPKLVNKIQPGTYKKEIPEPRLVIPIFNKDGKAESFQGRSLRKDAPQKYITIKAFETATKIYGVERVKEGDVWVMEGPIDSLFIPNAIAITGGSIDLDVVPFKERRVWVMDNEPRHPDTIARMKRLVDAGERVMFWDRAPWRSKDVNDMVMKENATPQEILEYMKQNISSGLHAKMRLSRYSKI